MEFMASLSGMASRAGPRSFESLLKFTDLSPPVQRHMQQVYLTLAATLAVAALGCYVNMLTGIGGVLGMLGFLGCSIALGAIPASFSNIQKRRALLAGAAFSQGTCLGPLVNVALAVQPGVVFTALLGTTAVFACFSGAALLARRRSMLYLGGTLSSAVSLFALARLGTWFLGGQRLMFEAELYVGLVLFIGYVLFDTQLAVERAEAGDRDVVRAALDLFVNFSAIFVRVLVILLRSAAAKDEERERRSGRRRHMGRRRDEL